jgi:hypothetical protein
MIEEVTTGSLLHLELYLLSLYFMTFNSMLIVGLFVLNVSGMADLILVNSKFTAATFAGTFRGLHAKGVEPGVLYPAVSVEQFHKPHTYK